MGLPAVAEFDHVLLQELVIALRLDAIPLWIGEGEGEGT